MDIFEFAMEKEKFSENYYRQLAEKTTDAGLRNICTMLADEEVKHYKIIQNMKDELIDETMKTPVIKRAKKVFESMKDATENFNFDISELELYKKARDIEKQSKEFYDGKAEETKNPDHKKIFKKLADEEQKHYFILDRICDFVARPQWFLENAEMNHFDDYVNENL